MIQYRVDQIVTKSRPDGSVASQKTYEGGQFYSLKWVAEREVDAREDADRTTGEYQTSYKVTEIEI